MTHLNPYITFAGNCREAMTFYSQCLGGELALQTIGESPMAGEWPSSRHPQVMHAMLVKDGAVMLMASDMGDVFFENNRVHLSLTCSNLSEMESMFARLSNGGHVTGPLHDFHAGTIGTLTDRYGMCWMLYHEKTISG